MGNLAVKFENDDPKPVSLTLQKNTSTNSLKNQEGKIGAKVT